jgi:glutamate-1-semialdehyde aminotransferase
VTRYDFSNVAADTAVLAQGTPYGKELRKGMLLQGVDLMRVAGFVSAAHTPEIISETIHAFDQTIIRLQQEGIFN